MIRKHYPLLFPEGSDDRFRAEALARRSYELVSFLVDVMGVAEIEAEYPEYSSFYDRLAGFSRLITFDRRGSGLSDVSGRRRPSSRQRTRISSPAEGRSGSRCGGVRGFATTRGRHPAEVT